MNSPSNEAQEKYEDLAYNQVSYWHFLEEEKIFYQGPPPKRILECIDTLSRLFVCRLPTH